MNSNRAARLGGLLALLFVLAAVIAMFLASRAGQRDAIRDRSTVAPRPTLAPDTPTDSGAGEAIEPHGGSVPVSDILRPCGVEGTGVPSEPVVVEVRSDTEIRGGTIGLKQPCSIELIGNVTLHVADTRMLIRSDYLMIGGHAEGARVELERVDVEGGSGTSFVLELSEAPKLSASVIDTNVNVGSLINVGVVGDGPDAEPGGDLEIARSSFRVTEPDAYGVQLGAGGEGVFTTVDVEVPPEAVELWYATSCTIDGKRDACGPNAVLE